MAINFPDSPANSDTFDASGITYIYNSTKGTWSPANGLSSLTSFLVSGNVTATGVVDFGSLSDGTITITGFVDEDNMASDSATLIPTQQSVKAYADTKADLADLEIITNTASGNGSLSYSSSNGSFTFTPADITAPTTVYSLTGTDIDPANGGIQTKTFSADTTFTESLTSGESVVLMLDAGASYTITWPTITCVTSNGNAAPTLTANDTVVLWKVSTTLYGAYVGSYT